MEEIKNLMSEQISYMFAHNGERDSDISNRLSEMIDDYCKNDDSMDKVLEVEENWKKKSSVNTYSLRLCIKGTNIGQNGKGMTKEFALASAYAEFLERYQNGILVFRQEKPTEEIIEK